MSGADQTASDVVLSGELARMAGVSGVTSWTWLKSGKVPGAVFRAGRFEISRADAEQFVAHRRATADKQERQVA